MSSFDVEREAEAHANRFVSNKDWLIAKLAIIDAFHRCHDAAVQETEDKAIKDVCSWCRTTKPTKLQDGSWGHDGQTRNYAPCYAFAIHERRRRREEPTE